MQNDSKRKFRQEGSICLLEPEDSVEPLVGVQPTLKCSGIYPPGHQRKQDSGPMTYDFRAMPRSSTNTAGVRASQQVLTLSDALRFSWPEDAMAVRYLVRHEASGLWLAHQPRVNKLGLPWLEEQGFTLWVHTLFIDIDNPGHRPWTKEDLEEFAEYLANCVPLRTAGVYMSRHGWRVVQPLSAPVPVRAAEYVAAAHMRMFDKFGVRCDYHCCDWTHVFAMPKIFRKGSRIDFEPDLEHMITIDPTPLLEGYEDHEKQLEDVEKTLGNRARTRATRDKIRAETDAAPGSEHADGGIVKAEPIVFTQELPPWLSSIIAPIAAAIRNHVTDGYHDMYLAIGGSLIHRRVPYSLVPEIVARIALSATSKKPGHHRDQARDTCARHAAGVRVTGRPTLQKKWPEVAKAMDTAFRRAARQKTYEDTAQAAVPTLETARAELRKVLLGAGESAGVAIVSTGCGLGKTYAAWNAAAHRAKIKQKTALSFDKNRLAIQTTQNLRTAGSAVRRYRSPLSVVDKDGKPVCQFHEAGKAIQAGGQSVHWEFCEGRGESACPHQKTCKAYGPFEEDEGSFIATGNHALVAPLAKFAGHGLMVLDEPPPLLETNTIEPADLRDALHSFELFGIRYADMIRPGVQAAAAYIGIAELCDDDTVHAVPIERALIEGCKFVDTNDLAKACAAAGVTSGSVEERVFACIRAAVSQNATTTAPPVRKKDALRARMSPSHAKRVGRASKVYRLIYEAIAVRLADPALRQVIRVEEKYVYGEGVVRVAMVTGAREGIVDVLRRPGATVLLDANADLHIPVIKSILSTPDRPFFYQAVRIEARDRAPVHRVIAPLKNSSRGGWIAGRKPMWRPIVDAIRRTLAWVNSDPDAKILCLVSYKIIVVAMRATLSPESEAIVKEWLAMGMSLEELEEARKALAPALTAWKGEWILGHYGGLRGMDHAMRADTYVTLGDAWPNLGEVRNEIAFVGMSMSVEERARAIAAADQEQAHGRDRSPERTTPCRHLHVGNVLPGGIAWLSPLVEELDIPTGRIPENPVMDPEEFREARSRSSMTQAEFAEYLGISISTMKRYEKEPHRIRPALRELLRKFWE